MRARPDPSCAAPPASPQGLAALFSIALALGLTFSPAPQHTASRAAVFSRRVTSDIVCGWGPDPIWSELKIASIADAGEGLKAITVEAPKETVEGYKAGGQYVQVRF